jgi:DNA-binding LacI/PurR family transcriptional regulator
MRVSIKDIARRAGVSHSTVSRALADSPLVNAETKARIKRLAREMGYTPSAIARAMSTRRTQTVGLVVTTIADPFVAEVVRGIEETALDHGYNVILCNSTGDPDREIAAVRALREKWVDAVIVTASWVGNFYAQLAEIRVPVVLINNQQPGEYSFSVRNDDLYGGQLAGEALVELGHRTASLPTYLAQKGRCRANFDWKVASVRCARQEQRYRPVGSSRVTADLERENALCVPCCAPPCIPQLSFVTTT